MKEQETLLNYKIEEYEQVRGNLKKTIDENSEKIKYIEKLEKETRSYKLLTESYIKTSSHLNDELVSLKASIERYSKTKQK